MGLKRLLPHIRSSFYEDCENSIDPFQLIFEVFELNKVVYLTEIEKKM